MIHDTPESFFEQLPASTQDKRLTITFHGRIDNREELASLLKWSFPLKETPDSSLVLAAYRKWQKECAARILGDFTFVIWDSFEKQLYCARDPMGIKPFYYYQSNDLFAFASEMKGLLSLGQIPKDINANRIVDFLSGVTTDRSSTFYNNISRLEPGSFIVLDYHKSQRYQYHEFTPGRIECKTDEEYEEAFRDIFTNAVKCRLRSNGTIGSFLSGGLDSSSICCVAARELAKEKEASLHTFSGIFNSLHSCDEREYFQHVLNKYSLTPHYVIADELKSAPLFDELIAILDEPFLAPHVFMIYALLLQIKDLGIQVVLDGHDGDSAISYGNGLYFELAASGNILALWKLLRSERVTDSRPLTRRLYNIYKQLIKQSHPLLRQRNESRILHSVLKAVAPEFRNSLETRQRILNYTKQIPMPGLPEKIGHFRTITQPIQSSALEWLEHIFMTHGVTPRYPFFDRRLIEFCLALPASQKLRSGMRRSILRRAMATIVPHEILQRTRKTDFTPNVLRSLYACNGKWLTSGIDSLSDLGYRFVDIKFLNEVRGSVLLHTSKASAVQTKQALIFAMLGKWFAKV